MQIHAIFFSPHQTSAMQAQFIMHGFQGGKGRREREWGREGSTLWRTPSWIYLEAKRTFVHTLAYSWASPWLHHYSLINHMQPCKGFPSSTLNEAIHWIFKRCNYLQCVACFLSASSEYYVSSLPLQWRSLTTAIVAIATAEVPLSNSMLLLYFFYVKSC